MNKRRQMTKTGVGKVANSKNASKVLALYWNGALSYQVHSLVFHNLCEFPRYRHCTARLSHKSVKNEKLINGKKIK